MLAVGGGMPGWVDEGVREYARRFGRGYGFSVEAVPMARRTGGADLRRCLRKEGERMLARLRGDPHVVALAADGRALDTPALARRLRAVRDGGRNLSVLVGGPDGLDRACLERARERWSLSALTLPHPLVRIIIAEQLYRAVSLLSGHPYHRGRRDGPRPPRAE